MSDESPLPTTRYRVLPCCPDRLDYRGGRICLSVRCNPDQSWLWYAYKYTDESSVLELMRRPSMVEWAHDRFHGFDVITGSAADKIMQRLVRERGAEIITASSSARERNQREARH